MSVAGIEVRTMTNPAAAAVVGCHGLIATAALVSLPGRPQGTRRRPGIFPFDDEPCLKQRLAAALLLVAGVLQEHVQFTNLTDLHRGINGIPVDRMALPGDNAYGAPARTNYEIGAGGDHLFQ